MNQIGDRIKALRKSHKMTQKMLGARLGISGSTVGMYEQGRRHPDGEMLVKICNAFSITADCLLGVVEPKREAVDIIMDMLERIRSDEGVLLNGAPMSVEDREKLLDAIEVATNVMLSKRNCKNHP